MSESARKREKFMGEVMSPVSKLETARRAAAREQQKRIELACARAVAMKKESNNKRKALAKKLEPEIAKKVKKGTTRASLSLISEPQMAADEGGWSWFGQRRSSRQISSNLQDEFSEELPRRRTSSRRKTTGSAIKSASSRRNSRLLEGDEIKESILGSGSKETWEVSSRKLLSKLPGEGNHEYALRAASIRHVERQRRKSGVPTLAFDEKENFPADLTPVKSNSFESLIPTSQSFASNQKIDDDGVQKIDDAEEFDFETPALDKATSKFFSVWRSVSLVIVLFGMGCAEYFREVPRTPFCNTVGALDKNSTNEQVVCRPCPDHGECNVGVLSKCLDPYVMDEDGCVESIKMQENVERMIREVTPILQSKFDGKYCADWTNFFRPPNLDVDAFDDVIYVSQIEIENHLLNQPVWRASPRDAFQRTFSKAMTTLNEKGFKIVSDSVHVGIQHASWSCQLQQLIQAQIVPLTILMVFLGFLGYVFTSYRRKQRDINLIDEMTLIVSDKLIDQCAASKKELRGYPCDNLRDHIFDLMGFHGSERKRATRKLWPVVVQSVHDDSRIRQRNVEYRGRQVPFWEWISPDTTKSTDRKKHAAWMAPAARKQRAAYIQKTLDFGTPISPRPNGGRGAATTGSTTTTTGLRLT